MITYYTRHCTLFTVKASVEKYVSVADDNKCTSQETILPNVSHETARKISYYGCSPNAMFVYSSLLFRSANVSLGWLT